MHFKVNRLPLFEVIMKLAILLSTLMACSPNYVPPIAGPSDPGAPESQSIAFFAMSGGESVIADCSVGGPAMNYRFTTPATISIPFADGRAQITVIECQYSGKTLSTQTPPSDKTGIISVGFNTPRSGFWFKRSNGSVLYYIPAMR